MSNGIISSMLLVVPHSMPGEQPDRPREEKPGHEVIGLFLQHMGL